MSILVQAQDFLAAYKTLQREMTTSEKLCLTAPAVVCLAFSLELYLKHLYSVVGEEIPRGPSAHHVFNLYDGLPQEIKQEMFTLTLMPMRGDILSAKRYSEEYTELHKFEDQIKNLSNGFVEWRYAHEHASLEYCFSDAVHLIETIKILLQKILDKTA